MYKALSSVFLDPSMIPGEASRVRVFLLHSGAAKDQGGRAAQGCQPKEPQGKKQQLLQGQCLCAQRWLPCQVVLLVPFVDREPKLGEAHCTLAGSSAFRVWPSLPRASMAEGCQANLFLKLEEGPLCRGAPGR